MSEILMKQIFLDQHFCLLKKPNTVTPPKTQTHPHTTLKTD